jgi:N-acetylneuraminic acid mutarotase
VLVAGGSDGTHVLRTAERYDPTSNTWTAAAPMAVARWLHSATLLDSGQVVVAGGNDGTTAFTSVEQSAPSTDTWAGSAP